MFSGDVYSGADVDVVKAALGRLFNQPALTIEHMFAAGEVVIKNDISRDEAEHYQAEMARAGAIARVQRSGGAPPAATPAVSTTRGRATFDPGASQEFSLSGISAALMMCPRCGHEQLEGDFCAQCHVDVKAFRKDERRRAKEDLIIQRRIRELHQGPAPQRAAEQVITAADLAHLRAPVHAGFGLRALAGSIDTALVAVLAGVGYVLLGLTGMTADVAALLPPVAGVQPIWFVLPLVLLAALGLCGWFAAGGSPGYLLLRMRIRASDGTARAGGRLLLRALFWPLCVMSLIGMLLPLMDRRGRALHDLMSGTVVIVLPTTTD